MAMGAQAMGGVALAILNSGLLLVLSAVWLQNYRTFRSTMVLGLVAFSAILLLENVIAIYFFFASMSSLYASDPLVGQIVLVMRTLQFVAVASLTYATVR